MVDDYNDDELTAVAKQGLDRETDSREELENRYSTTFPHHHHHKEEEVVIAPEQQGPHQKHQQRLPVGDAEVMPHLLKIDEIIPWPNQPRRKFATSNDTYDEDVDSLAESIKRDGLHQAILVRPVKGEDDAKKYQIVYGERRWLACKKLGYDLMPARIVVNDNMSDEEAFKIAVTENWHRTDYTPQQREHIAYELWVRTKSKNPGEEHSTREVAEILGISQP